MNKNLKSVIIASFTSFALLGGCSMTSPNSVTNTNTSTSPLMMAMDSMTGKMNKIMMTGSPDQDFASMMIEHHKGAIEMANLELKSGKDSQLMTMAQNIVKAQQSEISMFQDFLTKKPATGMDINSPSGKELMATMNMPMSQVKGNTDFDFATLMIPHHQSAVDMANIELKYGKEDDIKKMAQNIITDQQKEIKDFQDWLSKNK